LINAKFKHMNLYPKVRGCEQGMKREMNEEEIKDYIRNNTQGTLRKLRDGIMEKFGRSKSLKWISKVKKSAVNEQRETELTKVATGEEMQIMKELNAGNHPVKVAERHPPELVSKVLETWKLLNNDEYWLCLDVLEKQGYVSDSSEQPVYHGILDLIEDFKGTKIRYDSILKLKNMELKEKKSLNELLKEKEKAITVAHDEMMKKLSAKDREVGLLKAEVTRLKYILDSKGYNQAFMKGIKYGRDLMLAKLWDVDFIKLFLSKEFALMEMSKYVEASARAVRVTVKPEGPKVEELTYVCGYCDEEFSCKPGDRELYLDAMKNGTVLTTRCRRCGKMNAFEPSDMLKQVALLLLPEQQA